VVWQRRGYGTEVGKTLEGKRITHVAFADDMSLLARSWTSLKRMVLTLRTALAKRGLKLHPSKCKAQTNSAKVTRIGTVPIDEDFALDVLPEGEGLKILGTILTPADVTANEIQNRVAAGWKLFWSMKGLLVNHKISVKRRLRLFDRTVSSCALWGCQSWTPRAEELRSLESARRAMLRRIVGAGRLPEEEWVHWIRRTTRKATLLAQACNVREWVKAHAMSKWAWAGHVARRPPTSWLWRVTTWRDAEWTAMATDLGSSRPLRPGGGGG
jgi:hypothetical protein